MIFFTKNPNLIFFFFGGGRGRIVGVVDCSYVPGKLN